MRNSGAHRNQPAIARPWPAVAFASALVIYLRTLSHDVGTFDTGEFQTIPRLFGVAHPTGYPIFTIVGGVWSRIPISTVNVRMNLLSAILFAAAVVVTCLLSEQLGARGAVACAGSLTFAFASDTWSSAVHVEVQSLHLLLYALVLLLWLVAREQPTAQRLTVFCLVAAIGVGHHALMVLMATPLLVALALQHLRSHEGHRALRTALPWATVALLVPLLSLAYLPLRASSAPLLDANPEHHWWQNIMGAGFRGSMGRPQSVRIWLESLGAQLGHLSDGMGIVILPFAALGVGVLTQKNRAAAAGLTGTALLASYAAANSTGATDRYLLGPVLVGSVLAAVGIDALLDVLIQCIPGRASRLTTTVAAVLFALVPLNLIRVNFASHDASHSRRNESNGIAVLNALPQRCVLWSYWDLRTELLYLRYIEHVRSDVTILDHRSTRAAGSSFNADPSRLYRAISSDPRYAGRPVCFIPLPSRAASSDDVLATRIADTDRPWGLGYLKRGGVYVLTPRAGKQR